MRKVLLLSAVCAVLCVPSVASASAITIGSAITVADGPGTTGGGEFVLTVDDEWSFITFCLQRTEYIDFTHTFTVAGISTSTMTDPVSSGGDVSGRDDISDQTAYLYTLFAGGALPGYDYGTGAGRTSSANNLQRAFWMFEQELPMDPTNPFVALANQAVTGGTWTGLGDVRVLNLTYLNGTEAQDQLAIVNDPQPLEAVVTPEPASLVLLGTGLSLAAGLRRRQLRRRQARADSAR